MQRSRHEIWDPDRGEYRYIEIQTYTPDVPIVRPADSGSGAGHDSPSGHAGHGGTGDHGDHGGGHAGHDPSGEPRPTIDMAGAAIEFDPAGGALDELRARGREVASMTHHHESRSERTAIHNGHEIKIITTYELEIDGDRLDAHLGVNADGTVHYHGMPNYATGSAVDLARRIIDTFPDDYPARPTTDPSIAGGA